MYPKPTSLAALFAQIPVDNHGENEEATRTSQPSSRPATLSTNRSLEALSSRGSGHSTSGSTSEPEVYYDARENFEPLSPETEAMPAEQAPAARPRLSSIAQAVASGTQMLSGAASDAASKLWSMVDLRTMLQMHADDPVLLSVLRGSDPEMGVEHTLTSCREQVEEFKDLIEHAQGLEPRFRRQVLGDIKAVLDALHPLEHGMPAAGRALKALVNLVNTWTVLVPSPLMADQLKTFAYTIGSVTRGVLSVSAAALRPTADGLPFPLMGGQLGRDANEIHLYQALVNGLFLTTVIPKKFGSETMRRHAEAVGSNLEYTAAVSVACVAMVITPFFWSSLNALGSRLQDGASRLGASIAQRAGFETQA